MISGFSSAPRHSYGSYGSNSYGNLPVPFNIPNVLYNLLFEDTGLEFDAKQSDMIETLRFSHTALVKMQKNYSIQEQELVSAMLRDPDNANFKEEHTQLQLDFLQANQHFKDLVIVISEMLTREQYAMLLKFSNIRT